MVATQHCSLNATVHRHQAATVANIDNVSGIVYNYNTHRATPRALWCHLLTWMHFLRSSLCQLNQMDKVTLTLFKPCGNCFLRVLRELFILYHEVMKIVSQIIGAISASMTVKNSKKANLRPCNAFR